MAHQGIRFIRVHGRIVPMRVGNSLAAPHTLGLRAGRLLAKAGPREKRAAEFKKAAQVFKQSPSANGLAKASAFEARAAHALKRAGQARKQGMFLGHLSHMTSLGAPLDHIAPPKAPLKLLKGLGRAGTVSRGISPGKAAAALTLVGVGYGAGMALQSLASRRKKK